MLRTAQFIFGWILLVALEIMRVYFIMPFPGSQQMQSVELAYFLHNNIFYFRFIGILIILFPAIHFIGFGKVIAKTLTVISLIVYFYVFYMSNYRFMADRIFYQPENKIFSDISGNKVGKNDLIIGVHINNQAKAYPIEVIGYHHQVRDTVGGVPVMVTYCTVCRTARVYSPLVDGKAETFRLVGMDHFNAMFEDESTGSWWRQVNGEAITGPSEGKSLEEIPSEQMTLKTWLERHPDAKTLQPDSIFKMEYEELKEFDEGTIASGLERKDSLSWKDKSWVVGVQLGMEARAYDWNDLLRLRIIHDSLNGIPILVVLEPDSATFHVWHRDSLQFALDPSGQGLTDLQTGTSWNWQGTGVDGKLKDIQLKTVQSYQEFFHSWTTFRPHSSRYAPGMNQP